MFVNLYNRNFTVFLADATEEMADIRQNLKYVLVKARIQIIDGEGILYDEANKQIPTADCSIHIIGTADINTPDSEGYNSPAGVQYRVAKALCSPSFKMFLWNPKRANGSILPFVNDIRRDIVENTIYFDKPSPIVFVEDLRTIMNVKQEAVTHHEPADIFFMYNELDGESAAGIFNMLRDVQKVTKLPLNMASDLDYNTYIREQLAHSKIGVIYYNYAGDWAVPFARQIWKDTGGNSSHTPLLVAGNSEHADPDEQKVFDGIMACTVDEQLRIPLDIKVFLDKNTKQQ
jgi:hypothetical protein